MESPAGCQMYFPHSFPFIARGFSGVGPITKRNSGFQELSAMHHCQCFYCRIWGDDVITPVPFSHLRYRYSGLPFPRNLTTGVNSPSTLQDEDAKGQTTKTRPHCSICDKTFARVSTLKIHMRIHSGEKPYQCTYCAKAFVQSANLVAHLRIHTGEKPYQCYICQKRFSQSSSVKTHIRTHTGERPFHCGQCGKCFSDRSTLSKHRRVHQKIVKTEQRDCSITDLHVANRGFRSDHSIEPVKTFNPFIPDSN